MLFAWAIPWAYTMTMGERAQREFIATGWTGHSYRSCQRPKVRGYGLFVASKATFCGLASRDVETWEGAVILAEGRASILGYVVKELRVTPPNNRLEPQRHE
jgi:hypothetical protein